MQDRWLGKPGGSGVSKYSINRVDLVKQMVSSFRWWVMLYMWKIGNILLKFGGEVMCTFTSSSARTTLLILAIPICWDFYLHIMGIDITWVTFKEVAGAQFDLFNYRHISLCDVIKWRFRAKGMIPHILIWEHMSSSLQSWFIVYNFTWNHGFTNFLFGE